VAPISVAPCAAEVGSCLSAAFYQYAGYAAGQGTNDDQSIPC
jgi:hypothetical protein